MDKSLATPKARLPLHESYAKIAPALGRALLILRFPCETAGLNHRFRWDGVVSPTTRRSAYPLDWCRLRQNAV